MFLYTVSPSAVLARALLDSPASCTAYYLEVAPYTGEGSPVGAMPPEYAPTWPKALYEVATNGSHVSTSRFGAPFGRVTCTGSPSVCTQTTPPTGLHAMAEFKPMRWAEVTTCPADAPGCDFACSASNGTETAVCWYNRGVEFRRRMALMGYTIAPCSGIATCQDTWAIQEFPKAMRAGVDVPATPYTNEGKFRLYMRAAARGLYDGPREQNAPMLGAVYMLGMGNEFQQAANGPYRSNMKSWLGDSLFWNDTSSTATYKGLRQYTLAWLHESYTQCAVACVQGAANAARLAAAANEVNKYSMHFARIAYASDAPGSAAGARLYFDGRYTPLLSGWYSRSDNGYGNNKQLDREAMLKFVRLQTYATRTWASVPGQVYPDRRIGFAFNVSASSVDGATAAERAANLKSFAHGFARAIKLGYSDTSNPQDVCEGAYVNCLPAASVATNGYWNLWNSWT